MAKIEDSGIKRIGVIDLGTNSVRFDVQKIGPGKSVSILHREKQMVRLGEGVFTKGKLDPKATRRTLNALQRFKRIAEDLHVHRIVAFGTSTLREVTDSEAFLKAIRKQTGISVRVISGEEEAKLIASAILAHEDKAQGKFALVDIGGGSTEVSVCSGGEILHCTSFPLGAARLQQLFMQSSAHFRNGRLDESGLEEMRKYVRRMLLTQMVSEDWPKVKRIIGSSGTIRALSRIMKEKEGTKIIHRSSLKKLVSEMRKMNERELLEIPGMEPKRVDIILSGSVLLEQCMDVFDAKMVYPTIWALRDGILIEETQSLKEQRLASELDLLPLFVRASRLGCLETHLKRAVINAELLFDRLKSLHRLNTRWKDYLLAAIIFRDSGWNISPIDHQKHAYYIIKNVELPFSQDWETEFVAQLCLCLEKGKFEPSTILFGQTRRKVMKYAFDVLLGLMKVCSALGPAHHDNVRLNRVELQRSGIGLFVPSKEDAELVSIRMGEAHQFFEETFKRKFLVQSVK